MNTKLTRYRWLFCSLYQYADSGYAYRTHFFPTNPGVDGVRAEPVTITLRKQGTAETLTVTITPQSTVGLPPNQIVLDGTTNPNPPTPPPPTTTNYGSPDGYLDYPNAAQAAENPRPTALAGWAADRNQPNVSIPIDIFVDGTNVATITANGNRPDVGQAIGDNGLHGYRWDIPAQYRSGARTFAVRYGSNAAQLINSPRTIDFGGTPPPPPPTGTPAWAQGFESGYTYESGSRNFTVYANTNAANVEVALNQAGASGAGWQSGEFYGLPAQSGNGYSHRREFNPLSAGQGGVSGAALTLAFRIDSGNGADGVKTDTFEPVLATSPRPTDPVRVYPTKPVAPSVMPQTATVDQSYSFTVPAFTDDPFNLPLTYTGGGLPGLAFNGSNRVISGTPTQAGPYNIGITARNRFGRTTTLVIGFTVNPVNVTPPNTCNYTGRILISESTNPLMLQIAVDVSDGTFTLANIVGPTSADGQILYHIDERDWVSSLSGLRFPQGFPLLIAVWDVLLDRKRTDRPHGEQRIVVY